MKYLLIFLILITTSYSQNYTYLVDKYTKETELEAKIIIKIAKDILHNKEIKLYIPNMKPMDKEIYSRDINVVDNCEKANFVFIKSNSKIDCPNGTKVYFFTNNYRKLIKNKNYIGAFFWSKSRPNGVVT
jgi:hypothetical protein